MLHQPLQIHSHSSGCRSTINGISHQGNGLRAPADTGAIGGGQVIGLPHQVAMEAHAAALPADTLLEVNARTVDGERLFFGARFFVDVLAVVVMCNRGDPKARRSVSELVRYLARLYGY